MLFIGRYGLSLLSLKSQPYRSNSREQWWGLRPSFLFPRTPDFLSRLVALSNCMRLSLKKAAQAGLSGGS
jgi:hypothetical protein